MKQLVITCMMLLLIGTSSIYAQERNGERKEQRQKQRKERKERIKSLKIAYMTEQLSLTPEESQKFWPVYNQYEEQLNALRIDARPSKKPEEMTDTEAEEFLNTRLRLEEEKIIIKRNLARDIQPIIGSKRVIIMAQSEDRFRKKVLKKAGKRKEKKKKKRKEKKIKNQMP